MRWATSTSRQGARRIATFWICMWRKWFSCFVTIVSSDSTMKILKMPDQHTHSNQLLVRKIREIEEDKIKVAAIVSIMLSCTIMARLQSTWIRTSLVGPHSCSPGIIFARQSTARGHWSRVSHPSQAAMMTWRSCHLSWPEQLMTSPSWYSTTPW